MDVSQYWRRTWGSWVEHEELFAQVRRLPLCDFRLHLWFALWSQWLHLNLILPCWTCECVFRWAFLIPFITLMKYWCVQMCFSWFMITFFTFKQNLNQLGIFTCTFILIFCDHTGHIYIFHFCWLCLCESGFNFWINLCLHCSHSIWFHHKWMVCF